MIALSNTSPLILLDKINCLWILGRLFDKTYITPSVNKEWLRPGDYITPEWIVVTTLDQKAYSESERLCQWMDKGEADAIALSSLIKADFILIDDLKARRYAKASGLPVIGTAGLLIFAKKKGLITEVKPLFESLKTHRFYLSDELYSSALILANEEA